MNIVALYCKTQQSVLMPIYIITLIGMTMCSIKISAIIESLG